MILTSGKAQPEQTLPGQPQSAGVASDPKMDSIRKFLQVLIDMKVIQESHANQALQVIEDKAPGDDTFACIKKICKGVSRALLPGGRGGLTGRKTFGEEFRKLYYGDDNS